MSTKAGFIAWEEILSSPFGKNIISICKNQNIDLDVFAIDGPVIKKNGLEHNKIIKSYKNIITWATHVLPIDQFRDNERNILFLDKGFIDRTSSIYMDTFGWNSSSSVRLNTKKEGWLSGKEKDDLYTYIEKHLGFSPSLKKSKKGPLLICLQGLIDSDTKTLENCYNFINQEKEIFIVKWDSQLDDDICSNLENMCQDFLGKRKKWKILENEKLDTYLEDCGGIVTNDRFMVVLALCRGIKVATTARGIYSSSDATLECLQCPPLLSKFNSYKFNNIAVDKFLYNILQIEFSIKSSYDDIFKNKHFQFWLSKN